MPFRSASVCTAVSGTLTTTTTGAALRVPAGDGGAFVTVAVHVSATSGTPTLNCKLQDSANGTSGWADVTGAAMAANLTAAGNAVFCGYTPKKFIRVVATVGGGSPSLTTVATAYAAKA